MILVVFALPEESREFRRAIGAVRENRTTWSGCIAGRAVRIAHCGVGPEAAARTAAGLLAEELPEMLIATGFAGALAPDLALGDIVLATNFSDPALLQRVAASGFPARSGVLASVAHPVETIAAKRALAATGALAVDMETAPLAAACRAAGVPFLALRAISDRADEPLPIPFAVWFDLSRQRPRVFSLLVFLAQHPGRIPAFIRFVRGLPRARGALAGFLVIFLASEKVHRKSKTACHPERNGGSLSDQNEVEGPRITE